MISAEISAAMRDPGSTQFRNWDGYTLSNGDRVICGEVNAKNGFGAYVGYSPFYIRLRSGVSLSVMTQQMASAACADAASGAFTISS